MTQEEKELLIKDLSARLTYGVIVDYKEDEYDFHHWKISTLHAPAYSQSGSLINTDSDGWIEYNEYKGCGMSTGSRPLHLEVTLPFLRSMSSMTEEEKIELCIRAYAPDEMKTIDEKLYVIQTNAKNATDFYNEHHIDYRGLIPMGLALEAPEDMYNTKTE